MHAAALEMRRCAKREPATAHQSQLIEIYDFEFRRFSKWSKCEEET